MGIFCADMDYGIGTMSNAIIPLRLMQVPPPDQPIFKSAAVYYSRADFSRVSDGAASIEWVWDVISLARLQRLLDFLDGAEYKSLYVRTDKRDGTFPNPTLAFKTYSAIMWKPVLSGQEGVSVARSPYALQTVKITFMDVVEVV